MRRARILDNSRYWRMGGTNWPLVKENFDAIFICAGIGFREDILLREHIGYAKEHGVPFGTFHIPDPLQNMQEQARFYMELPGVADHPMVFDWERPYTASHEPSAGEAEEYLETLDTDWIYSRWEILDRIGKPSWLKSKKLIIARYLYEGPSYTNQYRRFEPFFEQRGPVSPEMVGTGFESAVVAWQFTERGDARYYAANIYTKDPVYVYGMVNCDLTASVDDVDVFMGMMGSDGGEEDPPFVQDYVNGWNDALDAVAGKFRTSLEELRK